ncbi:MAG: hypothetical protein C4336_05485 [Armatimonadota bacterium]
MMRRSMMMTAFALMAVVATAQTIAIDGRNIPSEFGSPIASQTNYTGFGDRLATHNWGSELNQLFVRCVNGVLYIGITGNLEGNGNSIHLYIDTGRSTSNTFNLTTGCINCSVQGMSGVIFEHKPDWAIGINRYDDGQGNDNIYIDLHDLVNNQSTYIGAVSVGTGANQPQGGDNTANLRAAFDNANVDGVTSDPNNLGDPATATAGLEMAIPLSALGNPTGTLKILAVLTGGIPRSPVNLPPIPPDQLERIKPYLRLAERMGRLHSQLLPAPVQAVRAQFAGDWGDLPLDTIARTVLVGLFQHTTDTPVNLVNAPLLAQQRGVQLEWGTRAESDLYPDTLTTTAFTPHAEQRLTGTVFGHHDLRITHIDDLFVDIKPEGILLFTEHHDRPGIIGRVGTLLGDHQVNIAGMHVGRERIGGRAIMILQLDNPIPPEIFQQIQQLEGVESARIVVFADSV